MPTDVSENPTARATLVSVPRRYRPDVERWAVMVGISDYQHRELNLRWAHRDAQELHDLLLTPMGGSFAADHVQLLVNEAATTQAISRALRSFLKKPAKDDVVLIYFACHGGPDPDRPNNLYLLTHDTDPEDIAGTALPMREIDLSLRENLLAERVVILADTCHSAGIGGGIGRRSLGAEAGVMNAYLDAMSAARGGLALLTSAEASETSQEDKRWGDGHGVFTHYLLEGMRGAADGFNQPRDGKVVVGELFDYVRHQVQQATGTTRERVLAEFRSLARNAENVPALFYFAGYGSIHEETGAQQALRTLVCADSRTEQIEDLKVVEIAAIANGAVNLVTIADTGADGSQKRGLQRRLVAEAPATRAVRIIRMAAEDWMPVGLATIYAGGGHEARMPVIFPGARKTQVYGALTYALLKALEENSFDALTYRTWVEAAARRAPKGVDLSPILRGSVDELLFDPRPQREAVLASATRIELDAVPRAIELLKRQIAERSQQGVAHPDGWLSLGVAYGVLGDYPKALQALETAVAFTVPGKAEMNQVAAHDVSANEVTPAISYHLGRLLLASQQDYGRAVSELRNATRQNPSNGRAFYYLGQAIQEMVRRETLAEVENAYSAYLGFGAPVGHRRAVVEFLHQRAASEMATPMS